MLPNMAYRSAKLREAVALQSRQIIASAVFLDGVILRRGYRWAGELADRLTDERASEPGGRADADGWRGYLHNNFQ